MLSTAHELTQTMHLLQEAKDSLDADAIPYGREVQVGGMIEIPAAALSLNTFTRRLDFLSIGTNDLIQYTLAIDRTDDTVAPLYDPASGSAAAVGACHPHLQQGVGFRSRCAARCWR
jgi:phosphotransferase system enzyme I (PtsI)